MKQTTSRAKIQMLPDLKRDIAVYYLTDVLSATDLLYE